MAFSSQGVIIEQYQSSTGSFGWFFRNYERERGRGGEEEGLNGKSQSGGNHNFFAAILVGQVDERTDGLTDSEMD